MYVISSFSLLLWFLTCNPDLPYQTLPTERTVDWTLAGLRDTSTLQFDIIDLESYGLKSDGVTANDDLMKNLLESHYEHGVIFLFSKGEYLFRQSIRLKSNMILKGMGIDQTHLIFDLGGKGHAIVINGSRTTNTLYFAEGSAKDDEVIRVNDITEEFQDGDWIQIIQDDEDWITSDWALGTVGQIVKIRNVINDQIFLESPLRMSFEIERSPRMTKLNMERNIGIECLKISRSDDTWPQQSSNIRISYSENCWISSVESFNCTYSHVDIRYSSNFSLTSSYLHHSFDYGSGGRAYGVILHFTTNECKVENNIFERLRHAMILQGGVNGNVFSYNYSIDPFWTNQGSFLPEDAAGDMVLHGNYPYANLFEQNICQNIVIDNSHGSNGPFNTFFRNRAEGFGIFFSASNSPYQNILGNEITNSNLPYSLVNYTILGSGHFLYGNNNKGTIHPAGSGLISDLSYAYSSRPDFVPADQWAKIGSPNSFNTGNIPAKSRYEKGELNDVLCNNMTTSIHHFKSNVDLPYIYPNPGNNYILLRTVDENITFRFSIYDLFGQLHISDSKHPGTSKIDISRLSSGVYVLVLHAPKEKSYKFIKQ